MVVHNIYTKDQRKVGHIIGGIYHTHRNKNHFMIKYSGFGISEGILEKLKNMGVKQIKIYYDSIYKDNDKIYVVSLEKYLSSPNTHVFKIENPKELIYDRQVFVSIYEMETALK